MKRAVVMVRPDQSEKLVLLAAQAHVSTAEINRRAIDAYDPQLSDEQVQLEQLAEVVINSTAQAMAAVKVARKEIKKTLNYFAKKEDKHGHS